MGISYKIPVISRALWEELDYCEKQGSITTTYDRLFAVFGAPQLGPDDKEEEGELGHVTCEWFIKFEDGTVASIYDWKKNITQRKPYDWKIGGFSPEAVNKVQKCLQYY